MAHCGKSFGAEAESFQWFFSTDLSFYVRGGRISKAAGMVGTMLNICPLLNMDVEGRLAPREKLRGKRRVIQRVVEQMEAHAQDGLEYSGKCFICHSLCLEDARTVAGLVEERFPRLQGRVEIFPIGTTIGSHTGPGTVSLFFWGSPRTDAEIKAELERMALDSIIYVGVDTLEYLKRGGRITPAAAVMGSILNLKPLLKIEGERLDAYATVRGREACKRRLLNVMKHSVEEFHERGGPICIGAAGSFLTQEEGDAWSALAAEAFPGENIRYDPLALSIGCHTGPGAFGMAVSRLAKR